jgi:two-component system sensor histidine kinase DesK
MVALDHATGSFAGAKLAAPGAAGSRPIALELARRLHETVVQRLAGLSVVLGSESTLDAVERRRCRSEVLAALDELRACLEETVGADQPVEAAATVDAELRELCAAHPAAHVDVSAARELLAADPDPLVASVLTEGLRNARKHASPSRVQVEIARDAETVVVVLRNDGVHAHGERGCGMGLRLLGVEASLSGALIDSCADEREGWWRLSLILPATR